MENRPMLSPALRPPVSVTGLPATRGDLLSWRAERAGEVQRVLLSKRRTLRAFGWMLLGVGASVAVSQTGGLLAAESFSTVNLLFAIVAALGMVAAAAGLLKHRRYTRQLRREFRDALEIDRTPQARALPAGRIEPELRTIFDARDDSDLDVLAQAAVTRAEALAYGTGTMLMAVLGVLPLLGALICIPATFFLESTAERCAAAAVALFLLLPTLLMWGTVTSVNWLHQREANRLLRERPAYLMRAAALRGEATEVKVGLHVPPERIAVAVVFLGIGVLRFSDAPMVATITIGVCLLLILVAIVISRVLARRPQVLVSRVRADEQRPSVLQRPFARVVLTRDGDDLVVSALDGGAEPHRLPLRNVLAVEPMRWHPLLPTAVAVLSGDEPLLLTGAGMLEQVRALSGVPAAASQPKA